MITIFFFLIAMITCKDSASLYYAPSLFVNHGAGPMPVLGDKYHKEVSESLKNVSQYVDFNRVRAVLLVTAHREEDIVTISSGQRHDMIYDYGYGVPLEGYALKHVAPGAPELARSVHAAFIRAGINARLDPIRGWDSAVFIPMMLADPAGRIPVLQVSVLNNQNASQHFELGRILRPFREQGVAIIGSGLSYNNMAELRKARYENDGVVVNKEFDTYLTEVCTGHDLWRIINWEGMKGAREAHPKYQAKHLMPLIVNMGAAGWSRGKKIFDSVFIGKFRLSGFIWY